MEIDIQRELIVFYNIENLFYPKNIKFENKNKIDYNSGLRNWDKWKYINKLHKINHAFQLIQEKEDCLPALIGFAEVEGKKVLEDLITYKPLSNRYRIVHFESLDERGVDVALLYDKEKIEILHTEPISFLFDLDHPTETNFDTTRDVLYCKLKFHNEIIHTFVVHLPSKREFDINKSKRSFIINEIKKRIIKIKQNGNESVIILGDFNEDPNEENIQNLLFDNELNKTIINPYTELHFNKQYSTFYNKKGLLFDQILFSDHFIEPKFALQFEEAKVFNSEELCDWKNKQKPFRTYAGTRYLGGYSDHFPVYIKLNSKH